MADENTSAPATTTLKFVFEKETQNTKRYKEVITGEPTEGETPKPIVGSLYVRKDIAGDRVELTVTIS